jgi:phosphatidylglycerophosphate synthase
MPIPGRKLPVELESPIDHQIIRVIEIIGPYIFFNKHLPIVSPNMITTISLLLSIMGIYEISNNNYRKGAILTFVGYMFDCWDGYVARRFNMGSQFGDLYDHLSDIFKILFLIVIIFKLKIHFKTKIAFIVVLSIFLMFSNIYLGCQEQYFGEESVLSVLKLLCPNKSMIKYFRFTGTGTFFLALSLFIYNIDTIDKYIVTKFA